MVRTSSFHVEDTGSIPVRDRSLWTSSDLLIRIGIFFSLVVLNGGAVLQAPMRAKGGATSSHEVTLRRRQKPYYYNYSKYD